MPNWVTNNVTIKGSKKLIAKIFAEVKTERRAFDFNTIAPIPKELEGTRSPMQVISKKEYKEQELKIAKGELTEIEKQFGISRCLTQELVDEYMWKFGACDWYSWQVANWGTKWNACDVYIGESGDFVSFNTAWSTPFDLMVKLSQKYPKAIFEVEYADEDFGHNVGKYTLQNGDEIDNFIPNGGSKEAIELALTIQGGEDYYLSEIFVDCDDLSDWIETLIEIAYERDYLPVEGCGYPKFVLEKFNELALENENYELLGVIKKELEGIKEEN